MKLYLQKDGLWTLFENVTPEDLKARNIFISDRARVGEGASVGKGARVGDRASVGEGASVGAWARVGEKHVIATTYDCIVIGPLGSRKTMLTGYRHDGKIHIGTGCFLGTFAEFEKAVKEKHGKSEHGKAYTDALKFIKQRLK